MPPPTIAKHRNDKPDGQYPPLRHRGWHRPDTGHRCHNVTPPMNLTLRAIHGVGAARDAGWEPARSRSGWGDHTVSWL